MTFSANPEIECPDCDGEGWTLKRNLSLGPGLYEHDCEACKGHGWRSMTDDELDAAAERQAEDAMSEPPVTMQEDYERAQRQRRELRR